MGTAQRASSSPATHQEVGKVRRTRRRHLPRVYNLMVVTHTLARAHGHGLWPTPMEMDKTFNQLKKDDTFGMSFVTRVSKFVAQGACRNFR